MHKQEIHCINCLHCECVDVVHGIGECAPLEGETVLLSGHCICPDNTLRLVDMLIYEREERRKCGDYALG